MKRKGKDAKGPTAPGRKGLGMRNCQEGHAEEKHREQHPPTQTKRGLGALGEKNVERLHSTEEERKSGIPKSGGGNDATMRTGIYITRSIVDSTWGGTDIAM